MSAEWEAHAVCRGGGTEIFYPQADKSPGAPSLDRLEEDVARQWCGDCPVRDECLQAALTEEAAASHVYGVRGGRTARQRIALIRKRERESHEPLDPRIKHMLDLGYKQAEIAAALGVSRSSVNAVVAAARRRGENVPPPVRTKKKKAS